MDIGALMNSGVLEMYVLDLLPKEKRRKIGRLIQENEDIRVEVNAIEVALFTYASLFAVPSPAFSWTKR